MPRHTDSPDLSGRERQHAGVASTQAPVSEEAPAPIYDSTEMRSRAKSLRFSRHIREYFLFVVVLVGVTNLSSLILLHRVRHQEDVAVVRQLNWALDQMRLMWDQSSSGARLTLRLDRLADEWDVDYLAFAVRMADSTGHIRWHFRSSAVSKSSGGVWDSITALPPNFAVSGWRGESDYQRVVTRAEDWELLPVVISAANSSPQLGALERLVHQEMWLRGLVLAAFAVFTILFFRLVLLPFRDMRKRAAALAQSGVLPEDLGPAVDDPEYVIATFDLLMHRLSDNADSLRRRAARSERRARDLERFNEYMLASLSTGVLIVGPDGEILRLNRSAENILRVKSDDLIGRSYRTAGLYPEMVAIVEEGLRDGYVYSRREVRLEQTQAGGPKYLGINTSRILNESDEIIGFSVLLTDLTEIKQLYDELAENQRLADLGEMAAGLAHQLRNSIAAILGYGKLLRQTVTPETPTSDWVESIIEETDETSDMLTRFLDFARPLNPDQTPIDVQDVIREAIVSMADLAAANRVRVSVNATPGCETRMVDGDALLLKQVFINLIQNAIEAMPDGGGVAISVRLREPEPGDRQQFWISIADTGGGIPEDMQSRVFQPFFTLKDKGTGLGLPLAKKIAIVHGGNLILDHSSPAGTAFTVILPVETTTSPHPAAVTPRRAQALAFRH